MLFPKQFTVGVLNAVLSVSALAGVLCPPRWACLPICLPSGFVFQLGSGAVSASLGLSPNLSPSVLSPLVSHLALSSGVLRPPRWACLRSCLPICLPPGFFFYVGWGAVSASLGLSPNLSPSLSPIWSGMLCPPPWSCLSLVSGLVSQLLSLFCLVACLSSGMLCLPPLGLSFSCLWSCLRSCLPACLPSGPGCCVRLAGLVFLLSAVLSPVLSAFLAGMLCPPRWAVSGLVSQLVSHLVWGALSASLGLSFSCLWSCLPLLSLFCLVAFLSSGMLCLPPLGLSFSCLWSCLPLVWDAVFAFLARLPAQLVFGLVAHPVFQLGLSPKFHVRFVQLFGVYGGVIFMALSSFRKSLANRRHLRQSPVGLSSL